MEEIWKDRWDERYNNKEFAYGKEPNKYLKEQLDKLLFFVTFFKSCNWIAK